MAKINFMSFKKMNIENIGTSIDCIEMPIAYIASKYHTENFYYYIFASHVDRVWRDEYNGERFTESNNKILNEFSLSMNAVEYNGRDDLLEKMKKSIDEENPVFLLFDYYEMFYEEDHYKRNHIPHGVVLSAYDDEREVFILQESAHMRFTSLYPLQLTYDMVFKILQGTKQLIEKRNYFESSVYFFEPMKNRGGFSSIDFLKKYIEKINTNNNSLKEEIRNLDWEYLDRPEGMAGFKRRFSTSNKVFFDFFERILKIEDIELSQEYDKVKNEYLNFYEMLTLKTIRSHIKRGKVESEQINQYIKEIDELDNHLYKALIKILQGKEGHKNYALSSIVTASSESVWRNQNFSVKRLIDGERDTIKLSSMWSNALWDTEPWVEFELTQKANIQKIIMYHANGYPVCDYIIEASNNEKNWISLKTVENNTEEITTDYIDGNGYKYYRLRFIKPSQVDNAARLCQVELWG